MAITGTFAADFTAFQTAVDGAVLKLKDIESGSAKVQSAFDRMTDTFSGRRVIEQATLMAEVFDRSTGAAEFTTAELTRMGTVGAEALEKLRKTGEPIPEKLVAMARATRDVGTAAATSTPQVSGLHTSFSAFDSVLASMGIHIAPEIKGLAELGSASGQSIGQLGALATAGLATGALLGGIKFGRLISEFFDLDEAIGRTAAALLGWGDNAAQVAGANADVLALASQRIGHEVTSMTAALEINASWQGKWRSQADQSNTSVAVWQAALAKVRSSGDLPQLTKDIASQNFTLEELAQRYGVSVDALQFFSRETTKAAAAEEAASVRIHASNAANIKATADELKAKQDAFALKAQLLVELTKLEQEYAVTAISRTGTANQIAIASINASFSVQKATLIEQGKFSAEVATQFGRDWKQALDGVGIDFGVFSTRSIAALQETADNEGRLYEEMIVHGGFFRAELDKQKQTWDDARDAARGYGQTAVESEDAATAATQRHNEELEKKRKLEQPAQSTAGGSVAITRENVNELTKYWGLDTTGIEGLLKKGYSFEQAVLWVKHPDWPPPESPGPRVPGFAEGGMVMVGEQGPEAVRLPFGSTVFPNGAGGDVYNLTFHIVDTEAGIVRRVSDQILQTVKQGRKLATN
jgi:hypothetical protein